MTYDQIKAALAKPTYNAGVETAEGVKPHGYHLGTEFATAEKCVYDILRQPGVKSVALYLGSAIPGFGGKLISIYDWRDLGDDDYADMDYADMDPEPRIDPSYDYRTGGY